MQQIINILPEIYQLFLPRSFSLQIKNDSNFIETRRVELQDYLRLLIAVPHARDNPLLFEFLGLGLPPTARIKLKPGETLSDVRIPKALQKDGATFFAVDALTSPSKEITQTLKRYSDFEAFNDKIRYSYEDNHPQLFKTLPDFPIKRSKLLEDHDSKEFNESRRLLLQAYLHKLLKVPHTNENPHFWKFLGLVDYAYYAGQMNERLINPEDRTATSSSVRASVATPATSSSSSLTSDSSEEDTPASTTTTTSSTVVPSSPKSSAPSTSLTPSSPKNTSSNSTKTGGFSSLFKKENSNTTITGVKKVQTRHKQVDDDENEDL